MKPHIKPVKLDGSIHVYSKDSYDYLKRVTAHDIPPFKRFYINTTTKDGNVVKGELFEPLNAKLSIIDGEAMMFRIQYDGYYWPIDKLELGEDSGVIVCWSEKW